MKVPPMQAMRAPTAPVLAPISGAHRVTFVYRKKPRAQHRLVYDALQEFIDQGVHALAIEVL
jgi:hypothetical protein